MDKIANGQKLFERILNYALSKKTSASKFNNNVYVQNLRRNAFERGSQSSQYLSGYNGTTTYFHTFYANRRDPAVIFCSVKLDELLNNAATNPPSCYKTLGASRCLCDLYAAFQTELGKDIRKDAFWCYFIDELNAIEKFLLAVDSRTLHRAA